MTTGSELETWLSSLNVPLIGPEEDLFSWIAALRQFNPLLWRLNPFRPVEAVRGDKRDVGLCVEDEIWLGAKLLNMPEEAVARKHTIVALSTWAALNDDYVPMDGLRAHAPLHRK